MPTILQPTIPQKATTGTLSGSLYVEVNDSIEMWNAKKATREWAVNDDEAYGSNGDPIIYDNGILYVGGTSGFKGYNVQTGG